MARSPYDEARRAIGGITGPGGIQYPDWLFEDMPPWLRPRLRPPRPARPRPRPAPRPAYSSPPRPSYSSSPPPAYDGAPAVGPAPIPAPPPPPPFRLPNNDLGRFVAEHYADYLREAVYRKLHINEFQPTPLQMSGIRLVPGAAPPRLRRPRRRPRPRPLPPGLVVEE